MHDDFLTLNPKRKALNLRFPGSLSGAHGSVESSAFHEALAPGSGAKTVFEGIFLENLAYFFFCLPCFEVC